MAQRQDEPWSQLATRIPKTLHRELRLHCVQADVKLMDFVVAALREKLATRKPPPRASSSPTGPAPAARGTWRSRRAGS